MNKKWLGRVTAMLMTFTLVFGESAQVAVAAELSGGNETDIYADEELQSDDVTATGISDETDGFIDIESDGADIVDGDDLYSEDSDDSDDVVAEGEDDAEAPEPLDEYPEEMMDVASDYVMSETEIEIKQNVISHDVVNDVTGLTSGVDYVANEVICLADSLEEAETIAEAYCGDLVRYSYGVATISLKHSEFDVESAVAAGADPNLNIPAVEPNYIVQLEKPQIVSDSLTAQGSGYGISSFEAPKPYTWENVADRYEENLDPALNPQNNDIYQWMHDKIDTYSAWGVTMGDPDITVAVIDTGVYYNHEDLAGKVTYYDMGLSYEGDSRNDGYHIHLDDQGTEDNGHGTHVAGIIAATAGNGLGGAGVAPDVSILSIPLPIFDTNGGFPQIGMISALQYVAGYNSDNTYSERRADIINMSLGGGNYSATYEKAANRAYDAGVTVCVAMSNDSANNICYPAGFPHVIAVSSIAEGGVKSAFSTFGSWADVAAPGSHIYSTYNQDDPNDVVEGYYYIMDGTSMATPVVSGVCALYMSAVGHVDPDTMERVIKASVTKAGSTQIGTGIVNAAKMFADDLTSPQIGLVDEDYNSFGLVQDGQSLTVSGVVPKDSLIVLSQANFNGNGQELAYEDNINQGMIIYTTNGKNPAVKNGEVIEGLEYTGTPISVATLIPAGSTAKKKVTVKAACINAMGLMSKVATMTFTVDPSIGTDGIQHATAVEILNAPAQLIAGKSVTLTGVVTYPEELADMKVTWRIASYTDGDLSKATIDAKGTLKTNASQTGTLKVECISADGNAITETDIEIVKNPYPVKTITLDKSKETLIYSSLGAYDENVADGDDTVDVKVTGITDTSGDPGHYMSGDKVEGVTLEWKSSNKAVATVEADPGDQGKATVTAQGKGTATITCEARDGSNVKKTMTVTVVQDVEEIQVTGQTAIALGNKATYKVACLPSNANNKNVTWSVTTVGGDPVEANKISVSKGTVEVKTGADVGEYELVATATDGSGIYESKAFNVVPVKMSSAVITVADGYPLDPDINAPNTTPKTVYENAELQNPEELSVFTSLKLFNEDKTGTDGDETFAKIKVTQLASIKKNNKNYDYHLTVPVDMTWSSTNEKVVTVETDSSDPNGLIVDIQAQPGAKGTATIKGSATDGSGKSVSLSVTVLQPVDVITVTGQETIAAGSKATYKAVCLPANANNKNVKWRITDCNLCDDEEHVNPDLISVDDKGTVTVKEGAATGTYKVIATAVDGSGTSSYYSTGSMEFKIVSAKLSSLVVKADGLTCVTKSSQKTVYQDEHHRETEKEDWTVVSAITMNSDSSVELKVSQLTSVKDGKIFEFPVKTSDQSKIVWTSSNEKVVKISDYYYDDLRRKIVAPLGAKGTATIKGTATDGSGKSVSISVTVVQPVEEITVTGQEVIALGNKATYKATCLPANANNKNVDWKVVADGGSVDASKITVSKGTVTVPDNADVGSYKIVATATDGSGISGDLSFRVVSSKVSSLVFKNEDLDGYVTKTSKKTAYKDAGLSTTEEWSVVSAITLFNKDIVETIGCDEHEVGLELVQFTSVKNNGKTGECPITKVNGSITEMTWSTSNDKLVQVTDNGSGAVIEAQPGAKGTATIKGIPVDGSGKNVTLSVTVAQPVEEITVTGQDFIGKGDKATFKAAVLPSNANNKNVDWKVVADGGSVDASKITVSKGTVTVPDNADVGSYRIVATATDGSFVPGSKGFTVTDARTDSIKITDEPDKKFYQSMWNQSSFSNYYNGVRKTVTDSKSGSVTSIQLYTVDIDKYGSNTMHDEHAENSIVLEANLYAKDASAITNRPDVKWTTSDASKVAIIGQNDKKEVQLVAKAPGNVTITCTAQDGSGKKATLKVNSIVPVSSIRLAPTNNQDTFIGFGKSATLKPAFGDAYGTPTNTKVNWDYTVIVDGMEYGSDDPVYGNGKFVSVTSSGKISPKAKETAFRINVTATTTDGTNRQASYEYIAYPTITKIYTGLLKYGSWWYPYSQLDIDLSEISDGEEEEHVYNYYEVMSDVKWSSGTRRWYVPYELEVTSSNPAIASAYYYCFYNSNENRTEGRICVFAHKKGTVTITMTAMDGSGTKGSLKVKVY